jgi:hypothetical protein
MATVDLVNLLFTQILKINQSTLYSYSTVQDQMLYLFLIPHVLLFLFLYAFSFGMVQRVIGAHKGFSYLVGIISYIYIIYAGWYSSIVLLFINWLSIALALGLFLFFVSIIWHPSATTAGMKLMGEAGKQLAKGKAKETERKAVEEEVNALKKEIAALNGQLGATGNNPQAHAYVQMRIADLEAQRRRLESRL